MSRKLVLALCLCVFLCSVVLVTRHTRVEVKASNGFLVHNLNTGLNYTAIQDAITALETLSGHVIFVEAGIYYENVVVNKSVSLIGEDGQSTINGLRKEDTVVIEADNVTLTGFTVTNSSLARIFPARAYSGIYVTSDSCNISRNNITNNNKGIGHYNTSNNIICRNIISNNTIGINFDYSSNDTISGNYITNNSWAGINLDDSYNSTITENNITNNPLRGVELWDSFDNLIFGNNITKNKSQGVLLERSSNNIISTNSIAENDFGIYLDESSNNSLSGNLLNDNRFSFGVYGWGLLSHYIQSIDVSNLVDGKPVYYLINQKDLAISHATHPKIGYLALINSTKITVEGLTLANNSQGLLLAYTNHTSITNNNIEYNDDGVRLDWGSSNNTIAQNNIAYNNYGVIIRPPNNSIHGNQITNNDRIGISLWWHSNHTIVYGNNITNNGWVTGMMGSWAAVNLYYSSDSIFYNNNFINNRRHVISEGSTNVWDDGYPSGGNYWSGYIGVDSDLDGIGDTPHVLHAGNTDDYPLMGVFSNFNATSEYNVQTICNSTISEFQHNGTAISFDVTGEIGTSGFCRICIPRALMNETYRVFVSGTEILPSPELMPFSNSTHGYLYFIYDLSTKEVVIIPEFSSILMLSLFMITTFPVAIVYRRKRSIQILARMVAR